MSAEEMRDLFFTYSAPLLAHAGHYCANQVVSGYLVDFALTDIAVAPLLKVAIMIDDAPQTDTPRGAQRLRDRTLMKSGWQVITFTSSQICGDCLGCVAETMELIDIWTGWLGE